MRKLFFSILILGELSFAQLPDYIPTQAEWSDEGEIITAGDLGEWDYMLGGMISPCSFIKKDSLFLLYYIGADGERMSDGGPANRKLGAAISSDGLAFEKYENNPILEYSPVNNEEEGIFSASAIMNESGEVVIFYGAMIAPNQSSTSVASDVRYAVSIDGFNIIDEGFVLSHDDQNVHGYGDELFPIGVYQNNGKYYLYYIYKNSQFSWELGLAVIGSDFVHEESKGILPIGSFVIGGNLFNAPNGKKYLFVLSDFSSKEVQVREIDQNDGSLGSPIITYDFENFSHFVLTYREECSRLLMPYLPNSDLAKNIYLKTANVNSPIGVKEELTENLEDTLIEIYPNPFNDAANIILNVRDEGSYKLEIYDVLGRLILVEELGFRTKGKYKISFRGGELSSGFYYAAILKENLILGSRKILLIK